MSQNVLALAERFFTAIETSDVEALREIYHPDCIIWHSADPLEARDTGQGVADNLHALATLQDRVIGAKFEVLQREATETGFVQQHILRGTMPNGEPFIMPTSMICVVEEGRITRLDEYFDSAASTRLGEVLAEMA
jgi:ketosteroid isomerase-like protein